MSGIYIPNMEMPGIGEGIFIYHKDSFAVLANVDGDGHVLKTVSAVPVPDHGPLVDALKVIESFPEDHIFTSAQAHALLDYVIQASKECET